MFCNSETKGNHLIIEKGTKIWTLFNRYYFILCSSIMKSKPHPSSALGINSSHWYNNYFTCKQEEEGIVTMETSCYHPVSNCMVSNVYIPTLSHTLTLPRYTCMDRAKGIINVRMSYVCSWQISIASLLSIDFCYFVSPTISHMDGEGWWQALR